MRVRVFLILLLILVNSILVEDMDDDVGEAIFNYGDLYLIYAYKYQSDQYFVPFR